MPVLSNAKHERFSQEIASGKGPSEAYGIAGFASKSAKGTSVNASRLLAQTSVQNRVNELLEERELVHSQATAKAIEKVSLTKEWILAKLVENAERAMQAKAVLDEEGGSIGEYQYQGSVANRALELLGKELGMFVDRKEIGKPGEFEEMSADELRTSIARDLEAIGREDLATAFIGRGGETRGKPN